MEQLCLIAVKTLAHAHTACCKWQGLGRDGVGRICCCKQAWLVSRAGCGCLPEHWAEGLPPYTRHGTQFPHGGPSLPSAHHTRTICASFTQLLFSSYPCALQTEGAEAAWVLLHDPPLQAPGTGLFFHLPFQRVIGERALLAPQRSIFKFRSHRSHMHAHMQLRWGLYVSQTRPCTEKPYTQLPT